ncbi:hypothetical protein ACFC5Z_38905 [Streptomyces sp. NPDC056004]|uniref:hypothetical protein n=1 Tax=Streptomyces sp. NPDC056004 TaxID=3345677 RepID=UPI0035DF316E
MLPVVLANGLWMGCLSVLAGLDEDELRAYFTVLGYEPVLHDGSDMAGFRTVLAEVFAWLAVSDGAGWGDVSSASSGGSAAQVGRPVLSGGRKRRSPPLRGGA